MLIAMSVISLKIRANMSRTVTAKTMIMSGADQRLIAVPGVHHLAL